MANNTRVFMAAAAVLGRVFVCGAAIPEEVFKSDPSVGPRLKAIADSFRVLDKPVGL